MQKEQKAHSEEHSSLDAACEIQFLLRTFRPSSSKVPLGIGEGSSHVMQSLLAVPFFFTMSQNNTGVGLARDHFKYKVVSHNCAIEKIILPKTKPKNKAHLKSFSLK